VAPDIHLDHRLVAKGLSHVEGIGFDEIFSSVAKLTYVIFIFVVVVTFYLEVEHMDVKT
jgi:hypothetical protein